MVKCSDLEQLQSFILLTDLSCAQGSVGLAHLYCTWHLLEWLSWELEGQLRAGSLGLAAGLGPWLLSVGVSMAAWVSCQHGG